MGFLPDTVYRIIISLLMGLLISLSAGVLTAGADAAQKDPPLYIGLMVHLEGYNLDNEAVYQNYKTNIIALADIFDAYGARLTLEAKEPVTACEMRQDYFFKELEDQGHAVGVHADAGGVPGTGETWRDMAVLIENMKQTLAKQGVTVRHVSGFCSPLDWPRAVMEAGYAFVTGGVTWCLMSLPAELIPEAYKSCENPADCHSPYPTTLSDRLHAWTIKQGEPWTEHHDDGKLVMIPSAIEGLPYISEKKADPDYQGNPQFDEDDITYYIEIIEEALDQLDPYQPNFAYVGWSYGTRMPEWFARQWLMAIEPYVESGRVEWKTIPEMYDIYQNWRNGQMQSETSTIEPASSTFSAEGGTRAVKVINASATDADWSVSESYSWIDVSPAGGTGNGQVSVAVKENTGSARSAGLSIAGEHFELSQAAADSIHINRLWEVTSARAGDNCQLWAEIGNNQDTPLADGTRVWFWVTGPDWSGTHWIGSVDLSGLPAGQMQWYACEWLIPAAAPAGEYTYWAQVWQKNTAVSGWSVAQTFPVTSAGSSRPGKAVLSSPASGTAVTRPVSFEWEAVSKATWYYLWVNNASNEPVIQQWYTAADCGCDNDGSCSLATNENLTTGDYTWWIQTWSNQGYGDWSSGANFRLKAQSDEKTDPVALTSPVESESVPNPVEFCWEAAGDATWYYLWVNNASNEPVIQQWYTAADCGCDDGGPCSLAASENLTTGDYTWWIQTWNNQGYGDWSGPGLFDVTAETAITPIYVTVAGHIEDGEYYAVPEIYPQYRAKLLDFADLIQSYDIPFNLQVDYEFFMGAHNCETAAMKAETENTNVIDYLAKYCNFEIDAHQGGGWEEGAENYADVRRLGEMVTSKITETAGGVVWNWQPQYERFSNGEQGLQYPDFTWSPEILTLGVHYLHHESDFSKDDLTSGVWKPRGFDDQFLIHDETASMVYIGPGMSCTDWFNGEDGEYPPMETSADYVERMVNALDNQEIPRGKIYTVTFSVPQKVIFNADHHSKLTDQFDRLVDLAAAGKVVYATYTQVLQIWQNAYNSAPHIFTYENLDPEGYQGP